MLATSRRVLLLNRNWSAVGVVRLPRAMALLFSEYDDGEPKARIITPPPKGGYEVWNWGDWSNLRPEEGEDGLLSASAVYKIPEVVLLTRYESMPIHKVNFCRKAIWKRDEFTCQYTQKADRRPEDAYRPKDRAKARRWTGPSPMRLLKSPEKPEYSFIRDRTKVLDTWRHWIDRLYWEVPLDNDMEEDDVEIQLGQ